ncbi:hypothetical protein Vretifemale_17552 [Volvox reticuliferus]|uniref:Uncharacterized protein n=1 Tax=Volvox reticuliferus TaxID=1737510 RepID=A0A8J4CVU4_9CHLO|nr:hypothetical protein Vretifemale_17552 [Volvox reticuliferus]
MLGFVAAAAAAVMLIWRRRWPGLGTSPRTHPDVAADQYSDHGPTADRHLARGKANLRYLVLGHLLRGVRVGYLVKGAVRRSDGINNAKSVMVMSQLCGCCVP